MTHRTPLEVVTTRAGEAVLRSVDLEQLAAAVRSFFPEHGANPYAALRDAYAMRAAQQGEALRAEKTHWSSEGAHSGDAELKQMLEKLRLHTTMGC